MKELIGELGLKDLLDNLTFDEEEVQTAAMNQPKLFMAAATFRIGKMKKRQRAEAKHDDLRTDKAIKLRVLKAQVKMTEKQIGELVDRDPDIRIARNEVDDAKRHEEWSKLLLEAYDNRRASIKVLTQFAFIEDNFRGGTDEAEKMKKKREQLKRMLPDKEDAL